MTDPLATSPSLDEGDVYIYAHGNGGIYVEYGDGRTLRTHLDDAVETTRGALRSGARVLVAGEDTPLAVDVLSALGQAALTEGRTLEPFAAPGAPQAWPSGTTALMEAAEIGPDRVLDDLIRRGADVHILDESGSGALHHAAVNGNRHAVDAVLAAGADPRVVNRAGFTPADAARAGGHAALGDHLDAVVKASPPRRARSSGRAIEFSKSHALTVYVWFLMPTLVGVSAIVAAMGGWTPGLGSIIVLLVWAVAFTLIAPPPAYWAGGYPVQIDGSTLTIRRFIGTKRSIDLRQVTFAAAGGSNSTSGFMSARWLLLAHPAGHKMGRWSFRGLRPHAGELAELRERADRLVVVPLDGMTSPEVTVPVTEVLLTEGVPIAESLRSQYAWAVQTIRGDG